MKFKSIQDFFWYFLSAIFPMIIGVIKIPIFTNHYNETSYGYLGLVNTTYILIGVVLFSWLNSCLWRFYHKYKKEERLQNLFGNLIKLYVLGAIFVVIFSLIWYWMERNELLKSLIVIASLQIIVSNLNSLYIILIRINEKAKLYAIIQLIKSVLALSLSLYFAFVLQQEITSLILAVLLVELLFLVYFIVVNPNQIKISYKNNESKLELKELLLYGSVGLIVNLCFMFLASSDRYVIAWIDTIENVGVYDQVYKIGQLSIATLVAVFFNVMNPKIIDVLENNKEEATLLIRRWMEIFILLGVPLVFYVSFFSKEIANLLLGVEFRRGYMIMPFVFFTSFLHGVVNFYFIRLKFANKLKTLSLLMIVAAIFNVLLTIYLVKQLSYEWAVVVTLLTYMFVALFCVKQDSSLLSISKAKILQLLKLISILVFQAILYFIIDFNYELNFFLKITLFIFYTLIYYLLFSNQFKKIQLADDRY